MDQVSGGKLIHPGSIVLLFSGSEASHPFSHRDTCGAGFSFPSPFSIAVFQQGKEEVHVFLSSC
ncbi:MAG TPA: hypothetical protein VFB12_02650 [Ktedonobacteraceae bacterium]|nr:hypothetical protein [Ktedonobacteraceae bacterium]